MNASPATVSAATSPEHRATGFASLAAFIALAALLMIAMLSLNGVAQPDRADRATLLFLALCATACLAPQARRFLDRADAATWALGAAFFLIYTLARNAGPSDGWSLNLALLPDEPVAISWAARIAVTVAILCLPARLRLTGWTRGVLAALGVVAVLGIVMFNFLGRAYAVGVTGQAEVNPELLVFPLMQCVEFGAVAVLCNTVAADARTRRVALFALPALLWIIWARHHFGAAYVEPEQ